MPTEPERQDSSLGLVQRAQAGEADALNDLMTRHLPGLRAFIRARSGPLLRARESQSDLVQSVCREALRSIGDYRWQGEASFRNWLFTVALHRLRDKRDYHAAAKRDPAREARRGPDADSLADVYRTICGPSQAAIAREFVEAFEAGLDRIRDEYREIIVLSKIVGMSHREIAAQLGKSEGAVRTTLNRALARLAAAIQSVMGG